ncbi:MAG: serine hydrolase [Ignavibacteriales bacterium]
MLKRILLPVLFFITLGSNYAQQNLPAFLTDSLDTYTERALKMWQIPGAAICVVKDGKPIVMKGYGVLELGKGDKVDENTLFMIGSNTKAFTGTAMAMLENDGKCTLDDKVQKWLPDFAMKDPWVGSHLNLTDILCHRMGMETFQGDFMYWTSDLSAKEVIRKFGQLTPKYDFRTRWGYTNAGFAIAGACIQSISGKTWAEFIKERIFEPLKMNSSIPLSQDIAEVKNIAKPYTFDGDKLVRLPFPKIDNLAPAGSISSSVSDMSHWLIAQLDSGKYEGAVVLPLSVIQKTRKPQSIVGRSSNMFDRNPFGLYALGWNDEAYKDKEIVSHTGGVDGFVTSVTLLPSEKLGIVVLTNTDANAFYQAVKWEIIDAMLGLPYRDYNKVMYDRLMKMKAKDDADLKAQRDTVDMHLKPAFDLDEYTGRYNHEVYGYLNITKEGNTLVMSFQHHPELKGKLECLGGNRFLCTYSNPVFGIKVIPFHTKGSKVDSLTLKVADFVEYTSYEFIKE